MQNIEYMLFKIKEIDEKIYEKYQEEYDVLLNNKENTSIHLTLTPFDYRNFISLEADIELTFNALKRNANNILDYLNNLKKEYLNNFINQNDNKTDITIDEIDKMNELFLKCKDNFSIIDQRKILKEFALIYLFELLENKNNHCLERLDNSYFKTHLQTILIYINTLIQIGLLKNNIYVDLNMDITINNVLNIINNLEIQRDIDKEKILKL